jgi:hypothetical protein
MAHFNTDVQINLEIGFNSSGPNDTTFTWTNITTDLRNFDTQRGRSFELDEVSAGTGTFELSNTGRQYEPSSTGGAYAPNVDVMKPMRVTAVHSGTTYNLFRGFVESWPQQYRGFTDPVVDMAAVDGFKVFTFWEVASTSPEELSGARIGRILTAVDWPSTARAIDAGDVTCQAYTPDCAYALSEIGRVTRTEEGIFFMADTGGGLPYTEPLRFEYDDLQIWNDVTVVAVGTQPQASDSTASVDKYGRRKLRRFDTLHHNATSALDTAGEIVTRYKDPQVRIPEVTLDPVGDTGLWPEVLGREISDRVTIRHATKSGTTGVYSADFHIEGIRHRGRVGNDWKTTWLLSPST